MIPTGEKTYSSVLHDLAKADPRLVVMTAENRAAIRDLPDRLGDRFIDVGICEQTMIGMAAGLALRGRVPVVHALATFLTLRAFEFIRDDVGIALDAKMSGGPSRVFVVVGDGELNEGSVWEAALVASAKRLDNLVLIVDRNGFQANLATEALLPLEPLCDKLASFGFSVAEIDGHDHPALEETFARIPRRAGRPTAIIARTVRNRGLPSLEGRAERWFVNLTPDEVNMLLEELSGKTAG